MKKALLTGVTGQDGSYLAELLLEKGYEVHGLARRSSSPNTARIDHLGDRLRLHHGDLADGGGLRRLIEDIRPDEIYNLGAQSHVRVSFDVPEYTADATGLGALRLLEALRAAKLDAKFCQSSSSEMYGGGPTALDETAPFRPRSPYGAAKAFAYWMTVNYRESHGLFACNAVLFNHESERRGEAFVSRKVTRGLARVKLGKQDKIVLGNLEARRDWGYAKDYVQALWLMLQQPRADDYVIATNESHSVRELVEEAAAALEMPLSWRGSGLEEKAYDASGRVVVELDSRHLRPAEIDHLRGNPSKAERVLGWRPALRFRELIRGMAQADLAREQRSDASLS